jgi:hypothetical protein
MSWARLSADADRAALDFMGGVSVIAGAVTGRGFLEENKELVFDDGVEVIPWLLRIKTAEFGHLDYNHSLVVDGIAFKATRPPEPLPGSEIKALSWSMVRLAKVDAPEETVVILDGGAALVPVPPAPTVIEYIYDGGGA